jgi:hypothetical protein
LNYEPDGMTRDELVESTYEAALGFNRIKGAVGVLDAATAAATDLRIREARQTMRRID